MNISDGLNQEVFKCIKEVIPRANNVIFRERNAEGDLDPVYRQFEDPHRPGDEHGYIQPYHGDSGSPFWITTSAGQSIVVAIEHAITTAKQGGYYGNELAHRCRTRATKLTDDMLNWIDRYVNLN